MNNYINLSNVKFRKIICNKSAYGVIWDGIYKDKKCVIKMMTLINGIHYDKDSNKYYTGKGTILTNYLDFYKKLNFKPFVHIHFLNKRAINIEKFSHEVSQQTKLAQHNLAPKIYSYGITHKVDGFKYCFIIMEKWETNVKDLLICRGENPRLKTMETELINKHIDKLHKHDFYHGDLKPNNIGVNLLNGEIKECIIFDCYTVRDISNLTIEEKEKYHGKDFFTFNHYKNKISKH